MDNERKNQGIPFTHDYYTNQMNIVLFVDVKKAYGNKSAQCAAWLFDNTGRSTGNGTLKLSSRCKRGTVVNWLVYALDMDRHTDGTWPSVPSIRNIVFLDKDGDGVLQEIPFEELRIYGGPDNARSEITPSYSYWAGNVRMDLPEGNYPYRLVISVSDGNGIYNLNVDGPSLEVVATSEKE